MARGITVTRQGVPVDQAADYQKVLDSRWRFMEVEFVVNKVQTVPAGIATGETYVQRTNLFRHNLQYVPAFHGSWKPGDEWLTYITDGYHPDLLGAELWCDDEWLYFSRVVDSMSNAAAVPITVSALIYNLPILEPYQAPTEVAVGTAPVRSNYGLRALDGKDSSVSIEGSSSHGFSVDTKKKVISVNRVGQKFINDWIFDDGSVTAVNTATDTFTIAEQAGSGGFASREGLGWIETGTPLTYFPNDFVTYPAPMAQSVTYYAIRTGDTTMKLALSKANALAGTAINITSAGSLPASIRRASTADDTRVAHGADYPPSFLFCETELNDARTEPIATQSLKHFSATPLVRADTTYLYFTGVQAVFAGLISYIILKDPIEVAQ